MANWDTLKSAISAVIKENGEGEITGDVLQSVLISIVNNVGADATLKGIASPSSNPGAVESPQFYFATETGTYVNFGGLVIPEVGLYLLKYDNGSWYLLRLLSYSDILNTENARTVYATPESGDSAYSNNAVTAVGMYRAMSENAVVNEVSVYAAASTAGRTLQVRVYKSANKPAFSNVPDVDYTSLYSGTVVWDADETVLKSIKIPSTSFTTGEYLVVMVAAFVAEPVKIRRYSIDVTSRTGFMYSTSTSYTQVFQNQFAVSEDGSTFSQAMPGLAFVSGNMDIVDLQEEAADIQVNKANKYSPRINLPSVIYAVVDTQLNIYYDAITLGLTEVFSVEVLSDIGQSLERMYQLMPESDDVGTHALTVNVYDSNKDLLETKEIDIIVISAAAPASIKNILLIGDSTLNNGPVTSTVRDNFDSIGANLPIFWGGKGIEPARHQGWPGATVENYATAAVGDTRYEFDATDSGGLEQDAYYTNNGSTFVIQDIYTVTGDGKIRAYRTSGSNPPSADGTLTKVSGTGPATILFTDYTVVSANPLWNTGTAQLDIANYRNNLNMGAQKFDVVAIRLGVNDSFGTFKTEEDRLNVINNLKVILAAFIADNALTKFIIELPTTCGNTRSGWGANYGAAGLRDSYESNVWRLRELMIEHFDEAGYSANVEVCATGCMVDRYFGYELVVVQSSIRISEIELRHTNAVHPTTGGYYQLADAIFPHILKLIQ